MPRADPFAVQQQQQEIETRIQIDQNPSTTISSTPSSSLSRSLPVRLRPESPSTPHQPKTQKYCCCCPVGSGAWILSLFLVIPSIALVLCFNIADLQAYVQFNSPAPVKVFFSVLYCLYALLGIAVAVVLPKVVPPRRFKPLIALYWVVITMTILEGVYFGIVMSKQKSKFIDYCDNGPSTPAPTPTIVPAINGTASAVEVKSTHQTPKPLVCRNGHAVVGLLYIMGPGGWIALHIGWILMVVLYSKALRRQYPIEDDYEEFPPHRNVLALSLSAHKSQNQSFSSRPTSSYPLGGAKAFQGGIGGMPGGDKDKKGSEQDRRFSAGRWNAGPLFWQVSKGRSQPDTHQMHSIDGDDALSDSADFEHRVPPAKESEEEGEDSDEDVDGADQDWHSDQSTPHRRGSSSPEGSLSSRTDIPADGKGWWIRQIEGKRRGEICPCTIGNPTACWCGKQRRTSHPLSHSCYTHSLVDAVSTVSNTLPTDSQGSSSHLHNES